MRIIDVATVRVANKFETRIIFAPRDAGGIILLDVCPRGTVDVNTFYSFHDAAEFMRRSPSTVRRQWRAAQQIYLAKENR